MLIQQPLTKCGHRYLSSVWLGVDLRTDTKRHHIFKSDWTTCSIANIMGGPIGHDHLMGTRIFTWILDKIFTWALKYSMLDHLYIYILHCCLAMC